MTLTHHTPHTLSAHITHTYSHLTHSHYTHHTHITHTLTSHTHTHSHLTPTHSHTTHTLPPHTPHTHTLIPHTPHTHTHTTPQSPQFLSLLPGRVLRLLEFVGFSGERSWGVEQLEMAAKSTTFRGSLSSSFLLAYYTVAAVVLGE